MKNKTLSINCYKYFCEKEGNQHIAGLYALEKILDIIDVNRPKRILEIGLGIGSIAYTIMKYAENKKINLIYHGTEDNEYCLIQLRKNLNKYFDDIDVYTDLKSIKINSKYDFIIIDGSDESLEKVKDIIAANGIIFIEGGRAMQTKKMNSLFPNHRFTTCISDFKIQTTAHFLLTFGLEVVN